MSQLIPIQHMWIDDVIVVFHPEYDAEHDVHQTIKKRVDDMCQASGNRTDHQLQHRKDRIQCMYVDVKYADSFAVRFVWVKDAKEGGGDQDGDGQTDVVEDPVHLHVPGQLVVVQRHDETDTMALVTEGKVGHFFSIVVFSQNLW